MALRSEAMASRISGWGSGKAAGAAAGCGVAAGTAAAAEGLGDAVDVVTDKHSASASITRAEKLKIFSFIVRSMTFKIFSRAPDMRRENIILAPAAPYRTEVNQALPEM